MKVNALWFAQFVGEDIKIILANIRNLLLCHAKEAFRAGLFDFYGLMGLRQFRMLLSFLQNFFSHLLFLCKLLLVFHLLMYNRN